VKTMASRKVKGLVGLVVGAAALGAGLNLGYEGTDSIVSYVLNPDYSILLKGMGTVLAGACRLKLLYEPKPIEKQSEE